MKKKVIFIVLPIVLAIVIIAAIMIGIFVNRNKEEEEESIGSKWGDTYYAYLKAVINEDDNNALESKYGISKDMEDGKIQFCKIENEENPKMVLTYKKGEDTGVNVYKINDNGNIEKKVYSNKVGFSYLYNVETQTYGWYICKMDNDGSVYVSIENAGNENEESSSIQIADKETTITTEDNKNVTITEFDKIFIKPEIDQVESFDFSLDIKENDLEKEIKESIKHIQEPNNIVSEEQKEQVSKKVEELKNLKKIADELNEKNKSIIGTWRINSNVKSNDPNSASLNALFGSSLKLSSNELILKEEGTFTFYVGASYNTTGKYKFENNVVSVYDIKDTQITESTAIKKLEENLKFEYIKYNNHEFLKLQMHDIPDVEAYVFFEKNTTGKQGTMTDAVPEVTFKTPKSEKTNNSTTNNQSQNSKQNVNQNSESSNNSQTTNQNSEPSNNSQTTNQNSSSSIKVGEHTLSYGTYKGKDSQYSDISGGSVTWDVTIKLNSDGTYIYQSTNQDLAPNKSGKYKVGDMYGLKAIIFDGGEWFLAVPRNNVMSVPAGSGSTFEYQGS